MTKNFIDSLNGLPIIAERAKESTSGRDLDSTISLLNSTKQNNISGLDPALGDTSMFLNKQGIWVPGLAGETGPTGPCGPVGPSGLQGFCGPVGETGLTGSRGDTGTNGVCGPIGFCGPKGSGGDSGLRGFCGPLGNRGDTGGRGIKGFCGPLGWRGTDSKIRGGTGNRGATGQQGICGPSGPYGFCGPLGNRGLTGDKGPVGFCGPRGIANVAQYIFDKQDFTFTANSQVYKAIGLNTVGSSCIMWVPCVLYCAGNGVVNVSLYDGSTYWAQQALFVRSTNSLYFVVGGFYSGSSGKPIYVALKSNVGFSASLYINAVVYQFN